MKKPKITVIGSINMDLVVSADQSPDQGETLLGNDFQMIPGGKGANQAVAAARLGADVTLIGCVGDDAFGEAALLNLQAEGVDTSCIEQVKNTPTGIANILITGGDNRIIVVPGANNAVTGERVIGYEDVINRSDLIMMQLEIPVKTVTFVCGYAEDLGIPVLLNPAPVQRISAKALESVSWLTPNESEEKALKVTPALRDKLIVTMGKQGVRFFKDGKQSDVPGYHVDVVDTTGAGDTFNGALAVQVASGEALKDAICFANAAAALSVTKFGAQAGMPSKKDVIAFLDKQEKP